MTHASSGAWGDDCATYTVSGAPSASQSVGTGTESFTLTA